MSDTDSLFNASTTQQAYKNCVSSLGERVPHGQLYYPHGHDKCTTCRCTNGEPTMCHSVTCSVPANLCPAGQEAVVTKQDCCSFACVPSGSVWNVGRDGGSGGGPGGGVGGDRGGGGGGDGGFGLSTDSNGILTLSVALIAFLLAASFCALLYLLYLNRRRRYELQQALLERQLLQQQSASSAMSAAAAAEAEAAVAPMSETSFAPFKPPHSDPPPSYWDNIDPVQLTELGSRHQQRQIDGQLEDTDSACSVDGTGDNCSLERQSRSSSN